jgi:hypothetical protein
VWQAQFRQRLAHGLQKLFSYTWAYAIDNFHRRLFRECAAGRYAIVTGAQFV